MMFHMMNESRIGTGHNANTQGAAACYFAGQYARSAFRAGPPESRTPERSPSSSHEDYPENAAGMKAHVEGIRAMIFKGFYYLDIESNSADREKAKKILLFCRNSDTARQCYGFGGEPRRHRPGHSGAGRSWLYSGISRRASICVIPKS